MREADIQNSIRLALNDHAVIFRVNSGKVRLKDGRYFHAGVPKGYSDLSGFRKSDGKAVFIEVKTDKGQASDEQLKFIDTMRKNGAIAGIARSADEAIKLVTEG